MWGFCEYPPCCQPPEVAEPVELPEDGPDIGPGPEPEPEPEPGGSLGFEEPGLEVGGLTAPEGTGLGGGGRGPPGFGGGDPMGAAGPEEDVAGGADEADSTGGGGGALVPGEEEPVPSGGGAVVIEALWAGDSGAGAPEVEPGAAALEAGTLDAADEGAPFGGVGAVELPEPPPNLPAKHCVMSGTSVSPEGVRERT